MTTKVYKTAKGKPVDIGALRLQNENVRAVGNMNVNARGDRIDANGDVIDPRNQQIQRRMQRQSNVSNGPVHSSSRAHQAEQAAAGNPITPPRPVAPAADPLPTPAAPPVATRETTVTQDNAFAAAMGRTKTIAQALELSERQKLENQIAQAKKGT